MKLPNLRSVLFGIAAAAGLQMPLLAAPFQFANDDLLLGVQATGGTGANINVFVNLGKTTDYLAGGNPGTVENIGALLASTYGNDWFQRTDLWFGVVGNRSHLDPTIDAAPAAGEDPSRVWYVSRPVATAGSSSAWPAVGGNGLGLGGTKFSGLKRIFRSPSSGETLEIAAGTTHATVLDQNIKPVAWGNSWTKWNPTPGTAFEIWSGGIQNNFGKGGAVLVDVQRVAPGQAGVKVATISIDSTGSVAALPQSQGPQIPAFVDTDGDGLSDFLEDLLADYGLDKNVSQPELVAQVLASQKLYTPQSIQELRGNGVLIQASGGNVNLSLPIFKSVNLTGWQPAGNLTLSLPQEGDKQFYRIEIGD